MGTKGLVAFVTLGLAGAAALVLATNGDSSASPDVATMDSKPATAPNASPATLPEVSAAAWPSTPSSAGRGIERLANDEPDSPARVETGSEHAAVLPGMAAASEAVPSAPAPAARRVKIRPATTQKHPVTPGASGSADARASAPPRDPDAELVAAIMARMEPVAGAANPAAGDRHGTFASLVRDCHAMEDSESALACRRRICAGYWGKAQACPKSMAPTASSR